MQDYRYCSVPPDNRLDWRCNTEAVCRKGQSRCSVANAVFSAATSEPGSLLGIALELVVERRIFHKIFSNG